MTIINKSETNVKALNQCSTYILGIPYNNNVPSPAKLTPNFNILES